jgi:hypothetical protein
MLQDACEFNEQSPVVALEGESEPRGRANDGIDRRRFQKAYGDWAGDAPRLRGGAKLTRRYWAPPRIRNCGVEKPCAAP